MTETELLAMAQEDYMNSAQLAFFRQRLQDLRQEILDRGSKTAESLRESASLPDPADQATREEERLLEIRNSDRDRKLMKKINEALERLEMGDYGYCEKNGEPIGLPRLLARPTATLGIDEQTRREIQQRQFVR